jgi:hypothetical protein
MADPSPGTLVSVRATCRDESGAECFARGHGWGHGRGVEFDERAPRPAALEHLIGAAAGELLVNLRALARRRRLVIDGIEALAEGEVAHPLAVLGVVGEDGAPALALLRLRVFLAADCGGDDLDALWREALGRCVILNTLRRAVLLELGFTATP